MKLILPKMYVDLVDAKQLPLFFLAGPILGGADWHVRMSELLEERFGDCVIANPSRYDESHPLYRYRMAGKEDDFPHQTAWERYYMHKAADAFHGHPSGCLIFWLAAESKDNPRTDGNPYAMDTRGEIGEWRGRMMQWPPHGNWPRVVMGADPNFPGLRTIIRNNETVGMPMFETMEEVVEAASRRILLKL